MEPMPGCRYGQALRITSPSGGSTLTTSAPKSPRIWVAYGPITTVVRSRTRTPSSGPLMSSKTQDYRVCASLFRLDVGKLDELGPVRDFALDELAELGRSHGCDVDADGRELLLHFAFLQRLE